MTTPALRRVVFFFSTRRARAIVFLACNGFILAALYFLIFQPLVSLFADREDLISERSDVLSRYREFIASASDLEVRYKPQASGKSDPEYFDAADDGVLDARLQTVLKQKIEISGARLYSTRSLAPAETERVRYVGAHVEISGSMQQVQAAIKAVESNRPYLFIEEAAFSSQQQPSGPMTTFEPTVESQMNIYGAVEPSERHE